MDVVGKATLEEMKGATWYNEFIYKSFRKYLKGNILEIGSGIGNFTTLLGKSGKVTSTDIRKEYLKMIKNQNANVQAGFGDIEKNVFFFKGRKFDSIISLNVFEHIKNDEKALENTYNLLRKNGSFVILVPAHAFLFSRFDKELGHFRRYSASELTRKLQKAGFKIVKVKYFNWWAAIGWFVFIKTLGVGKMPSKPVKIFDIFGKYFLNFESFFNPPFGLSVIAVCKK